MEKCVQTCGNPSLINSPSQNEIVGRFPGRVHSLVVRWFPVWTPSQTQTSDIDLCGVNGLVAVHWPNLYETRQVGNMTRRHAHSKEQQRQFTASHPLIEQAAKHFVLSSHAMSVIQSFNEITGNRLSRMCNDMSMGKRNSPSRFHVWIV